MYLMDYISPSSVARLTIIIVCLISFFLQSHQEIVKFLSNRTSVSTRFVTDVEMRYPKVVICLDEPFKSDIFPMTSEAYLNSTYSLNEVFVYLWPNVSRSGPIERVLGSINVTEIATFWYGRCFVLEIPLKWARARTKDRMILAELNAIGKYKVYFLDRGQELCVINGPVHCDKTFEPLILGKLYHEVRVKAKKVVQEAR